MKEFTLAELKLVTSELSVLYVEDEKMIRDGLYASLKQLFAEVEIAEDGAVGWEMYQNSRFHLVITDISMPNMDGITMIGYIKNRNPEAHIIVTSAQNDAEKLLTLINLGVDRFLTKPLSKINLIDALYTVCSAIDNKLKIKKYQMELIKKVRILETQVKKEHIKHKQVMRENSTVKNSEPLWSDYFTEILQEERDELSELNQELDNNILMAFSDDCNVDHSYVLRLAKGYKRYSSILNSHGAFVEIGVQLQEMGQFFETYEAMFIQNISSLRELLESFNFTLIAFRQNVWEKNSPHPVFYNASLLSDIQLIKNILTQTEVDGEIEFF